MSEDDKVDQVDGPCVMSSASSGSSNSCPLRQETVWLKQHVYENAEMVYQRMLSTGIHVKDSRTLAKEGQQDPDVLDKKLQAEGSSLLKTSKTIWGQLEQIEKAHNCKAQVVRDVVARLALAVEEYQRRMSQQLVLGQAQLNMLRSLVTDVGTVVDRTKNNLTHKKWGSFGTHEEYCQAVTDHLSQLDVGLHSCFNLYNSSQAGTPKPDINRIVGEINKISINKIIDDGDKFVEKKDLVRREIKLLMKQTADSCDSDSDTSLEGSCSAYSDDSDNDVGSGAEKCLKSQTGVHKSKTNKQKQTAVRSNRNNANNVNVANRVEKLTPKVDSSRPHSGQNPSAMPVKRNAQGAHTIAHKKPDLFQFRGISSPARVPFLNQPGLLGPRPNIMTMQGATQVPFRFSNFGPVGRHNIPSVPNSGAIHPLSALGQPRASSIQFNFSSSPQHASPFGIGRTNISQSSLLASMGIHSSSPQGSHVAGNMISNQIKQSKLLQMQQNQNKGAKAPEQLFGAKSGLFYPLQQNARAPVFLQNKQAGMVGSHSLGGVSHDNIEQQLNEMTQKIQQMQLATSQNLHLQQLMRETERLKQLVAMKQHQQQDQFKHQFQLLINAFMQQQQQQQMQGPQTKMARSIQFYNTQKQQQRNIHIRQQQTKKLKPENKIQQVKQEPKQEDSLLNKTKQASSSGQSDGTALQNGKEDLTLAADERKIISETCKVSKIGTFSPHTHGDKHRAGVSSVVVMEDIGCVVVVDIINSCLKLYNVTVTCASPRELAHSLVTRLELSRPYYMSKLNKNMIVVSREGKLLSLVQVSKNRLECLRDLKTETQYYGLGYVSDNVIVCAAFADGKIDLLHVEDGVTQTVTLLTQCKGPELVAAVPSTGCILYLGRVVNETVHLLGISQKGSIDFSVDLESSPTDVWSVASISDRIICCSKESGKVKLFSKSGNFLADISFPAGSVNQPFAMAFCDSGNMYIANDGAWDREYEHYVTTDINVYSFS